MILNNYWFLERIAALHQITIRNGSASPTCPPHGMTPVDLNQADRLYIGGVDGDFYSISGSSALTAMQSIYRPLNYFTCCVGTGDTPVTANDHKLDNDVTNILVNRSDTGVISDTGNEVCLTRVFSGQNPTSEDIVIKEVGLKKTLCCYTTPNDHSANTWSVNTVFLMAREVLETPIVIPPNESRSVVVKLKFV